MRRRAAAAGAVAVGADWLGYSFDEPLGADAAQLFLVPVAVRVPAGRSLTFDLYAAWADGRVERGDTEFVLSGPVDTQVKASFQAAPWALVGVTVGAPTGNATHTGEEAVVASVLSNDLLGFQEASWGGGTSVTGSLATAFRAGSFGVGVAAAYAVRGGFEPSADDDLTYRPGDETRLRVGVDRNVGTSTLTAGGTFSTFARDRAAGRNLFQAGDRVRVDVSWVFRAGAGVWTIYASDLWRENGDLTLEVLGPGGLAQGDTTLATASQNLVVAGVVGAVDLGPATFLPHLEVRRQAREEPDGGREGTGWLVAGGGDLPLRVAGAWEIVPRARVRWGSILDAGGLGRGLVGAEFSATLRWSN